MKRPAFQFYPKDWRGNLKLRRCSDAAKGAWIEIMCFLHDSEEYGVARFPLKELVTAAGVQLKSARELVDKGALKGGDKDVPAFVHTPTHAGKKGDPVTLLEHSAGPMWYSSRMVRDEWLRGRRGESTRFTPDHQPPTKGPQGDSPSRSPTPRQGEPQGDGAAVASASAVQSLRDHRVIAEGGTSRAVDNPGQKASTATHRNVAWRTDSQAAERKYQALFGKPSPSGKTTPEVVAIIDQELARRERSKAA